MRKNYRRRHSKSCLNGKIELERPSSVCWRWWFATFYDLWRHFSITDDSSIDISFTRILSCVAFHWFQVRSDGVDLILVTYSTCIYFARLYLRQFFFLYSSFIVSDLVRFNHSVDFIQTKGSRNILFPLILGFLDGEHDILQTNRSYVSYALSPFAFLHLDNHCLNFFGSFFFLMLMFRSIVTIRLFPRLLLPMS